MTSSLDADFRPRPGAHRPPENPELDQATAELGELFGIEGGAGAVTETPAPTREQVRLIREVIDPDGMRRHGFRR